MERIEMVEKLRERVGVSYEDAKTALEESEWDLLDAVVGLEKQGKVGGSAYSTKQEKSERKAEQASKADKKKKGEGFEKCMAFAGRMIHKGNTNSLQVMRGEEKKFSLPLTAVVLLLAFLAYVIVPLLIVSLFFGYSYKFAGPELGRESINNAMQKASRAAENVKTEFKETHESTLDDLQEELEDLQEELEELKEEIEGVLEKQRVEKESEK